MRALAQHKEVVGCGSVPQQLLQTRAVSWDSFQPVKTDPESHAVVFWFRGLPHFHKLEHAAAPADLYSTSKLSVKEPLEPKPRLCSSAPRACLQGPGLGQRLAYSSNFHLQIPDFVKPVPESWTLKGKEARLRHRAASGTILDASSACVCMYACMPACMYVCVYVYVYKCIYIYISTALAHVALHTPLALFKTQLTPLFGRRRLFGPLHPGTNSQGMERGSPS